VIASDSETIKSLVMRAGGVLPQADPKTFRLVRLGRQVPIELDRVMAGDPQHNIVLYPGDVLQIRQENSVVTVGGAVERQVAVPYRKSWSVEDYIAAAGGYAEKANKAKVVVEYPSGAIGRRSTHLKMFQSDPKVEPGSSINVALDTDAPGSWKDALQTMVQISSVLVSLAIVFLAVTK
jgi:protein involved in polysaccharide export with SLBB domain